MKITFKSVAGFILIMFGISLFFGGGPFVGLIPAALGALFTYIGIKNYASGNKVIGILTGLIGVCMLGAALPFLFGMLIAAVLIYFGWKMVKSTPDQCHAQTEPASFHHETNFDAEWEEFLKKK